MEKHQKTNESVKLVEQEDKDVLLRVLVVISRGDETKTKEQIDDIAKKICFDCGLNQEDRVYLIQGINKLIEQTTEEGFKKKFTDLIINLMTNEEKSVLKEIKGGDNNEKR